MRPTAEQLHIIKSGGVNIIPEAAFVAKLDRGEPLRIKLGVDPTAPDLHLGHAVPLRKMRQFQDLGHQVVLIIGNGTALIGDPSGRNTTRPPLTPEEIATNAATYVEQAIRILDEEKTEIVWNNDWLGPLQLGDILKLAAQFTARGKKVIVAAADTFRDITNNAFKIVNTSKIDKIFFIFITAFFC